jgi:hypothetical protein
LIRVVARSCGHANRFRERHPDLCDCVTFEFCHSYYELLNRLIESDDLPYVCVVHDDITLAEGFASRTDALVSILNRDWPTWGLVGNAGILSFRFGFASTSIVRYLADTHCGPNLQGHVLPAQSIDGNMMLLNIAAMRRRGLRMPAFEGFQLYDLVLSIEAARANLAVLVAPELACWHDSGGTQNAFDAAAASSQFQNYLRGVIANRSVPTLNGELRRSLRGDDWRQPALIDLELDALRNAAAQRPSRTTAICVRTRFERPLLLRRALETIHAFIAAAGEATRFVVYIVTDKAEQAADHVPWYATTLAMPPDSGDSRNKLIKHAARHIDAHWFWFVDDDDWLFPNEAERLGLILNVLPSQAAVFLDTQHFKEELSRADSAVGDGYHGTAARYFPAQDFVLSLSGVNHIPICGMVVSRDMLRSVPDRVYDRVVYYEDYSILLYSMLDRSFLPIVVDKLYAGISLHNVGNSVSDVDRTKWNVSMSELVACITCQASAGALLTMPMPSSQMLPPGGEVLQYLSGSERFVVQTLRILRTALRVALVPSLWVRRFATLVRIATHNGPRGVLQQMVMLAQRR